MKQLSIRRGLAFIINLFMILALCVPTLANDHAEVVRVGYFDLGSYYSVRDDGTMDSYDAAFLDEICKYTNYTYEYVDCGTWDNALAMLEAHEIDLIGTMQWTSERESIYEICDASYGYSVAELAALDDSDYIYEDYSAIDGSTVGCIDGYVIVSQLNDFMERKNMKLNVVKYNTQSELDAALEAGEIDMAAVNAHSVHEEWKVVDKFAYAPFYFASWKGNDILTETISEAIIQIHIYQSDYEDNLIKQYFPQLVSSPYSKQELDCISRNNTYNIYFDGTTAPLVWYDESTDSMDGVLVNICEQLAEQTGLDLRVCHNTNTQDISDQSTVTYRTLYYNSGSDASDEIGVTNSILDQDFEMYHKIGDSYKEGGKYTIAVVNNRDGLVEYLTDKYPECVLTEYDTPDECMKQMVAGNADMTFLNTNIAENLIITECLDQTSSIPMTRTTFGIALEFHGKDSDMLAGIIDKGMQLIDEAKVNNTLVSVALNTKPNENLSYFIKQHMGLFIASISILIIVVIIMAILITYAKVIRQQSIKVEKANRARTDFFSRMSHDMRTPMNGIMGMADLSLQENNTDILHENIAKIKDSGEYMINLINDTLDLQRLESGKMKFNLQLVEVIPFFNGIFDMAATSAKNKK